MFPTPSCYNKRNIPYEAMVEFDEKLNHLYFSEQLEEINYSHYQSGDRFEKLEFFAETAKNLLQGNCPIYEQLAHDLTVRLGMNFRYIIRALSKDNIASLCHSIKRVTIKYFEENKTSLRLRTLNKKSEVYRNQVFNDIVGDLSLGGPDRALHVLKKFEEYHQTFTFGCPNQTSIEKLTSYVRAVLEKQKQGNQPDCVEGLLNTLDKVVFDGVVYSIKHVTGCARSALVCGLFNTKNTSSTDPSPPSDVNFTTSWLNKLSRTHQGCKTPFRRDLMTCARLALHDMMLVGLKKVRVEEVDSFKALIKGASNSSVEKVIKPLQSDPVWNHAMKQYDLARNLVDVGGTATLEDVELVTLEIMTLPNVVLDQLKRQGTRIIVCREGVTEVLQELKGKIPRGYTDGSTWDSVLGCNDSEKNIAVIATTIGPDGKRWVPPKGFRHGCQNICMHEVAHAFDLNHRPDSKRPFNYFNHPSFANARAADLAKLPPYCLQPDPAGAQETFAESASRYFGGDPKLQSDWPNIFNFWFATDQLWREKYPEGWFG